MKTLPILVLILFYYNAYAGDPQERLKELIKGGHKVYVTSNKEEMIDNAKKILKDGCWQIVENEKDADFILKFMASPTFVDYKAYAVVIDPQNNEWLYKTPSSNTSMSLSLNVKRKVLKKLIAKHVIPLCETGYVEKMGK